MRSRIADVNRAGVGCAIEALLCDDDCPSEIGSRGRKGDGRATAHSIFLELAFSFEGATGERVGDGRLIYIDVAGDADVAVLIGELLT